MNKYIYILGTVAILFVVGALFIKLLPILIAAGLIIYAVSALKGKIKSSTKEADINNRDNNNKDTYVEDLYNSENYTNGEVIDVDYYEEVDKK
ncbi:MAG: hypothetical protein ACI398_07345 [Clostridium sp.]